MRSLPLVALFVLAAGCHASHGSGDRNYQYFFKDAQGFVSSRVDRTVHRDGSESLHAVTVEDFDPSIAIALRADEEVELDATGRLVSADASIDDTYGTTEQKKKVVLDAIAGVVHVQRPAGAVDWTVPTDEPWSYYHFGIDTVFSVPISSPLAAWVLAKTGSVSSHTHLLVWDDLYDALAPTAAVSTLYAGPDTIHVGSDFVESIDMGALGESLTRTASVVSVPAVDDVPLVAATVSVPDCSLPGTATPFTVTSSDGTIVKGEVDTPPVTGPYPYVVFNAGTGGSDRDEYVGGAPRWTCLAKSLLEAGIAVTRYDDRGHGLTGGDVSQVTFHERSEDAAAVAAFAAAQADLAPGRLFLLGHSEGVAHVSEAAIAVPDVSGLILFSGVGTNGEMALFDQERAIYGNYGFPPSFVDEVIANNQAVFAQILAGTYPQPTLGGLSTEFWKEFLEFNGASLAAGAARPTAIFQGTADWQVLPKNAGLLAAAITSAGVADVTVHTYPGDGHFESHAPDGYPASGDEYWIPLLWDDALVGDVIAWVDAH